MRRARFVRLSWSNHSPKVVLPRQLEGLVKGWLWLTVLTSIGNCFRVFVPLSRRYSIAIFVFGFACLFDPQYLAVTRRTIDAGSV